ncbi:MAG: presenilin family intramembrane aspartyl protease [Euryarchaeota archaeon]|nr:presenilin family intramembrane aspartyl protease [Euryarchaeota archaeon]
MRHSLSSWIPVLTMPVLLLATAVLAVILATPMTDAGIVVFEDPSSLANPLFFIVVLLFFTGFLLLLIRYKLQSIIRLIILASLFLSYIYVFSGLLLMFSHDLSLASIIGTVLAGCAIILLSRFPEWYVIDVLGVLLAGGIASIFGISLQPVPVIVLLIILAVYDAISVYRTKHMLTLADGVMQQKVPIMVIVPKRRGYSFKKEAFGSIKPRDPSAQIRSPSLATEEASHDLPQTHERPAYLMGLGDLIMPTILVVSAAVFVPGGGIGIFSLCSLTTVIGSLIGLCVLMSFVKKGSAHAGLPPLNGGAIIGFIFGFILMNGI